MAVEARPVAEKRVLATDIFVEIIEREGVSGAPQNN